MAASCSTPAVAPDTLQTPQTASKIARRLLCLPWWCCQAGMNTSPGVLQATGAAPYGGGPIPASLTLRGSGKRKLQNISSDLQVDPLKLQRTSPPTCLGPLHRHRLGCCKGFGTCSIQLSPRLCPLRTQPGVQWLPCPFSGCGAVHMLRVAETRIDWLSLLRCRGSGRVPSCCQGCAAALQGRRCRCDGWFDLRTLAKP